MSKLAIYNIRPNMRTCQLFRYILYSHVEQFGVLHELLDKGIKPFPALGHKLRVQVVTKKLLSRQLKLQARHLSQ